MAEYTITGPTAVGGTNYLTADHLGTPRVITQADGVVKSRHDYLPFGEEISSSYGGRSGVSGYGVDEGIRQKFTQKERDIETGLDYFLARYYSNVQGRFTSVDPENHQAMLDPTDPQSWNAYSYVNNNPLSRVDPDGRGFWDKLKNAFFYGYFVENDEIARLEKERREWLSQHYYEDHGDGMRPYDPSKLSRQDVFDKYREVKYFMEQGQVEHLSDSQVLEAWNRPQ